MIHEDMQIEDFIQSLADAITCRRWETNDDVPVFTACWIALGQMEDSVGDLFDHRVSLAFATAIHTFADDASDDAIETWEHLFDQACTVASASFWGEGFEVIAAAVVGACRDYLVEASDETCTKLFNCWEDVLPDDRDRPSHVDIVTAVIATYSALFGLLVVSMLPASRGEMSDELRKAALDLSSVDVQEDVPPPVQPARRRPQSRRRTASSPRDESGSNARGVRRRGTARKAQVWTGTYEEILACREEKNEELRGIGKPYYTDEGANYLAEAVARVRHLKPKPEGMSAAAWVQGNPDQVILVDARRIVLHVNDSLVNAPQSAVKGRLTSMANYFPGAARVGAWRDKRSKRYSFDGQPIDSRYAVALFNSGH